MINYSYHKMYLEDKLFLLKSQYDRYSFEIKLRHNYINNKLYDKMYQLSIEIDEVEKAKASHQLRPWFGMFASPSSSSSAQTPKAKLMGTITTINAYKPAATLK